MALIKCKECGHEVSDRASACPNCGCPIESLGAAQEDVMYEEPKKKKGWIWALIVALLCLVLGGGYYAYTKFFIGGSNKDAIVELTPEFTTAIEKYDQLGIFSEGYAAVRKGDKWGYINTKGEEVIPTNIDAYCVGRFSEGLAFVAYGMGDAEFSVIDKKGNVVFKKNGFNCDSEFPESHEMPYFINGKIYVHTTESKEDVYDKLGNKLETVSLDYEKMQSVYQKVSIKKYIVFANDSTFLTEHEGITRPKYGIKDSLRNVLVKADYDGIALETIIGEGKSCIHIAHVSNGVALVKIDELDENQFIEDCLGCETVYYGYVDMKGNDTFSAKLKERCRRSEFKAIAKYEECRAEQHSDCEGFDNGNNQPSYNSERIVNIYFRYGQGSSSIEGNYGVERLTFGKYITKIRVPQGKVWIFRDYCCSLTPKGSYTAGFCDETGRETIELRDGARKGWWREVSDMGGERFYGGKTIYMYWGAYDNFRPFNFEVNFIERDD